MASRVTTADRPSGTSAGPTPRGTHAPLRLPNAVVELHGEVPPSVVEALTDLTDRRLHVDPEGFKLSLEIRYEAEQWIVEPTQGQVAPPTSFDVVSVGSADEPATEADLLDTIVSRFNRFAFESDLRRLHLHAAAVEVEGSGVLLAGRSGSGKSTVTWELLRSGASYLTDECLTLLPGSSTVFAYPKPLTFKGGTVERFTAQRDHLMKGIESARNGRAHVRGGTVAPAVPFSTIGVIVALRYSAEEQPSFSPISAAEACVRLLGDSLDGVRLGPSALDVVAHVVAGCSAWELVYRDAADAAALIADIRAPLRRQLVVPFRFGDAQELDAGCPGMAGSNVSSDRSVRVARFETGAALHDGSSRSLAVLDERQILEIEHGHAARSTALRPLGVAIRSPQRELRLADRWAPMAFGVANRPVGDMVAARPVQASHAAAAFHGRCTGALADQVARGRPVEELSTDWRIRSEHRSKQSDCLLLERELPRLVDLLEAAGVEPVLTNGPVTAHDGLLPPHFRDFGDLDLLVPPAQLDSAVAAMQAHGFDRTVRQLPRDFDRRFAKSVTFRGCFSGRGGGGSVPTFEVDLHRTLAPGPFGELIPLDTLHERAVPVRIHGRWYRALHPDHRFVHACLQSVLSSPEPRLHSVRDLVMLAPRTPSATEATIEVARSWRASAVVRRAIEHAESVFPAALSPELLDAVRSLSTRRAERVYLASYHRPGGLHRLSTLATTVTMLRWSDRRDFVWAHLQHRVRIGLDGTAAQAAARLFPSRYPAIHDE